MVTIIGGIFYVLYLSIVAYYKIKANAVSSFDIGIFSQMFERMRHDFSQVTTLERDRALSHFGVHIFSYLLFDLALLYAISLCGNIRYRSNSDCLFCSYPALFDPKEKYNCQKS